MTSQAMDCHLARGRARSIEVRKAAAGVLRLVKRGDLDVAALLSNGSEPYVQRRELARTVTVHRLLSAIPGVGPASIARLTADASVSAVAPVGELAASDRIRLAEVVANLDDDFAGNGFRRTLS